MSLNLLKLSLAFVSSRFGLNFEQPLFLGWAFKSGAWPVTPLAYTSRPRKANKRFFAHSVHIKLALRQAAQLILYLFRKPVSIAPPQGIWLRRHQWNRKRKKLGPSGIELGLSGHTACTLPLAPPPLAPPPLAPPPQPKSTRKIKCEEFIAMLKMRSQIFISCDFFKKRNSIKAFIHISWMTQHLIMF